MHRRRPLTCTVPQFTVLRRLARLERLPVATHRNKTFTSLSGKRLIDSVRGRWAITELGARLLASRGRMDWP